MSLESKHYIATPADIATLTRAYSEAIDASSNVRGHYFRALIATTQAELGSKPRQRSAEASPTLEAEGIRTQLAAVDAVHERFYAVVLDTVNGNADERNRRSNFARSAVSTVRAYVRAGFDITLVAAARATKAALAALIPTTRRARESRQGAGCRSLGGCNCQAGREACSAWRCEASHGREACSTRARSAQDACGDLSPRRQSACVVSSHGNCEPRRLWPGLFHAYCICYN